MIIAINDSQRTGFLVKMAKMLFFSHSNVTNFGHLLPELQIVALLKSQSELS